MKKFICIEDFFSYNNDEKSLMFPKGFVGDGYPLAIKGEDYHYIGNHAIPKESFLKHFRELDEWRDDRIQDLLTYKSNL